MVVLKKLPWLRSQMTGRTFGKWSDKLHRRNKHCALESFTRCSFCSCPAICAWPSTRLCAAMLPFVRTSQILGWGGGGGGGGGRLYDVWHIREHFCAAKSYNCTLHRSRMPWFHNVMQSTWTRMPKVVQSYVEGREFYVEMYSLFPRHIIPDHKQRYGWLQIAE